MAATRRASRFIYEIQAEYSGERDLRRLQDDLNALSRIEAWRGAADRYRELDRQLRDARNNVAALQQQLAASGGADSGLSRQLRNAQREVVALESAVQRQHGALSRAQADMNALGIGVLQAAQRYQQLQTAAQSAGRVLAARNTLGVRSDSDIRAEMEGLKRAYRELATSGTASTRELQRAAENLRNRIRALRTELQGANRLDLARNTLGIRSDSAIRAEMEGLKRAYRELATSGRASMDELRRAGDNLRRQLGELRREMQGRGIDRASAARGLLGIRGDAEITARIEGLRRAYRDLARSGTASAAELRRAHAAMGAQIGALQREAQGLEAAAGRMNGLRSALAGFAAAFSVTQLAQFSRGLFQVADEYATLDAKIKLATTSEREAAQVREDLYKLSQQTGSSYQSNADAFAKLAMSMREAGVSARETVDIVGIVNKTLSLNGSSAGSAAAFMLQFSQAMASGVLQGDEFRSMMENNGVFAGKLAKALGTNITGLRQMSREGKLTSDVLLRAFRVMREEVDQEFGRTPMKISGALQAVRNAWEQIVSASNQASGSTQRLSESFLGLSRYLELNREGIREMLAELMQLITRLVEAGVAFGRWLIQNKEFVAVAVTSAAAVAGLVTVIKGVGLAIAGATAVMGAFQAALAAGALWAGGLVAVLAVTAGALTGATAAYREMARAQEEVRASQQRGLELEARRAAIYARISQETGVLIRSHEDLMRAQREGQLEWDAVNRKWVAGANARAEAEQKAAAATGEALKALVKEYKQHADEIRRIQEDIAGRQKSLAAELREMSRSGMTERDAWNDLKREAEEYAAAAKRAAEEAKQAAEAGDTIAAAEKWKEAVGYADSARQAYKSLNREVKDGDQVVVDKAEALRIAMEGVRSAGELGIDILRRQQEAASQAMRSLEERSGFADLASKMDEATQKWLADWQTMRAAAVESVDAVSQKIVKQQKAIRVVEASWASAARSTRGLWIQLADDLKRQLDEATKTRTVTVYTNVVQGRRQGGLIAGFARGGKVPGGYGGGDRVPALLEPGEFVLRKEVVKILSPDFLDRLNANVRAVLPDLSALLPRPAAATAGRVVNINLTLPGGDTYQMQTDPATAARIEREQERWWALRSSNKVKKSGFARTL